MSADQNMNVNSKSFNIKHKFQEEVKIKPVPNELVQPFLYVEKVLKKS